MYHDLVEIEAGDVDFLDKAKQTHKAQNEAEAILSLKTKIPQSQSKKLVDLFAEFEENKTIEAKFAQAIDKLEPAIHLLDHTSEWEKRRFSEKVLNEKKEPFFTEFPSILACWKHITKYLKDNDLIDF